MASMPPATRYSCQRFFGAAARILLAEKVTSLIRYPKKKLAQSCLNLVPFTVWCYTSGCALINLFFQRLLLVFPFRYFSFAKSCRFCAILLCGQIDIEVNASRLNLPWRACRIHQPPLESVSLSRNPVCQCDFLGNGNNVLILMEKPAFGALQGGR